MGAASPHKVLPQTVPVEEETSVFTFDDEYYQGSGPSPPENEVMFFNDKVEMVGDPNNVNRAWRISKKAALTAAIRRRFSFVFWGPSATPKRDVVSSKRSGSISSNANHPPEVKPGFRGSANKKVGSAVVAKRRSSTKPKPGQGPGRRKEAW
mmetsp:Transcript_41549/g.81699  ORF Transcript_41549/g.81699 Transcript_41549/m.81699 type:complete len:152 (+) Transcript_41549:223-678(+)